MTKQERALRACVNQYRHGSAALWRACFAANVAVGSYQNGETRALAQALGRSVDTVESMARAARCYLALAAEFRGVPEMLTALRLARQRLYYSHFAELDELRARYHMTGLETYE